jgi:hypothetical protein
VEDLERQLRDTDGVRKAFQQRLEYANMNWECKLRLFVKDSDDRSKHTNEQMKKINILLTDLHAKSIEETKMHGTRERLMKQNHEYLERQEVIDAY